MERAKPKWKKKMDKTWYARIGAEGQAEQRITKRPICPKILPRKVQTYINLQTTLCPQYKEQCKQ